MANSRNRGFAQEASSTPITDDAEASINGSKSCSFFTLPTTSEYYIITGIEWKNGTAVAGDVVCGIDLLDADPPVLANTTTVAWAAEIVQAGTDAVQRNSQVQSTLIKKGAVCAVWVNCNSASSRFRYNIESSENKNRSLAYADVTHLIDPTAFSAGTTEYYLKAYFRGLN